MSISEYRKYFYLENLLGTPWSCMEYRADVIFRSIQDKILKVFPINSKTKKYHNEKSNTR